MQSSRRILIYNQFHKSVFDIIRKRSTIAAAQCPYAHQETTYSENQIVVERKSKSTTGTTCLPYSDVPGPKPIPILGNTWR